MENQEEYHQENVRPKTKTEGAPGQGKGYKAKGEKVTTTRVQAPQRFACPRTQAFPAILGHAPKPESGGE